MSGGFENKGPSGGQLTAEEVLWVQTGETGVVLLAETTAPSATTGYGKLYVKSSDHKLYFLDKDGNETDLLATGGTGSPGGVDTQVQFNDGGSFGGDAGFTYNKTTDVVTVGGLNLSGQTASRIVIFDASKNVISGDTATYPSLTELSYVKGVTSAIQTQIDSKQASLGYTAANAALSNLSAVAINTSLLPGTDDGAALGSTTKEWSDLFLASGGVINFANGTVTLTQSSSVLTMVGSSFVLDSAGTANISNDRGATTNFGLNVFRTAGTDQWTFGLRNDSTDKLYITDAVNGTHIITATQGATPAVLASGSWTYGATITPSANDGAALGTTTLMWSDLFLASGAVINFNNGDVTITHSADTLTIGGGNLAMGSNSITMTGSIAATGARVTKGWFTDIESTNMPTVGGVAILTSLTAPQFTTIELGAASDTTLSRVSAGVIAVEGNTILTVAGGTLTGSITLGENTSIALDPAGSADGKYSGITVAGTAGYTQAFGDLVYLDPTDSRWEAADANSASGADGDSRGILGMVVSAGTDGNACTILLKGIIRADAKFPAFTVNNPIYVSETAGSVTQTQPTTTDVVIRVVGFALTADEMFFNPSSDYITHT